MVFRNLIITAIVSESKQSRKSIFYFISHLVNACNLYDTRTQETPEKRGNMCLIRGRGRTVVSTRRWHHPASSTAWRHHTYHWFFFFFPFPSCKRVPFFFFSTQITHFAFGISFEFFIFIYHFRFFERA